MSMPANRVTESTGEHFLEGSQTTLPASTPLQPREAGQGGGFQPPTVSRRSVVATLLAAFAPAAGTAVVVPKVVDAAAVMVPTAAAAPRLGPTRPTEEESPELLALGAELEVKIEAYQAAAARLAEARATAAALWPEPAAAIVFVAGNRLFPKSRYPGCLEEEVDFEGRQWPDIEVGGGKDARSPRYIAVSGALSALLDEVRAEPNAFEVGFEQELVARIADAERYEDACAEAIEVSEIEDAKAEAKACAKDLLDLANDIEEHAPRTLAGVLIHARTLTVCAQAEGNDLGLSSPVRAATVLGRGLAEAVLRVAGAAAS